MGAQPTLKKKEPIVQQVENVVKIGRKPRRSARKQYGGGLRTFNLLAYDNISIKKDAPNFNISISDDELDFTIIGPTVLSTMINTAVDNVTTHPTGFLDMLVALETQSDTTNEYVNDWFKRVRGAVALINGALNKLRREFQLDDATTNESFDIPPEYLTKNAQNDEINLLFHNPDLNQYKILKFNIETNETKFRVVGCKRWKLLLESVLQHSSAQTLINHIVQCPLDHKSKGLIQLNNAIKPMMDTIISEIQKLNIQFDKVNNGVVRRGSYAVPGAEELLQKQTEQAEAVKQRQEAVRIERDLQLKATQERSDKAMADRKEYFIEYGSQEQEEGRETGMGQWQQDMTEVHGWFVKKYNYIYIANTITFFTNKADAEEFVATLNMKTYSGKYSMRKNTREVEDDPQTQSMSTETVWEILEGLTKIMNTFSTENAALVHLTNLRTQERLAQAAGGSLKQYVTFDGRRYVVRIDGRKRFIETKKFGRLSLAEAKKKNSKQKT